VGRGIIRPARALFAAVLSIMVLALLVPSMVGGAVLTVRSGSMEPSYPVGSVVVVWPTPPERVGVGDVVTFVDPQRGANVTHRVVEVDTGLDGRRSFVTRGDANDGPDARPVREAQLVGRVVATVPKLGVVAAGLRTPVGWFAMVVLPALLYVAAELTYMQRIVRGGRRDPVDHAMQEGRS
jgi:signal peptidase